MIEVNSWLEEVGDWVVGDGVVILFILLAALITIKFMHFLVDVLVKRYEKRQESEALKAEKLGPVLYNIARVAVVLLTAGLILQQLGLSWTAVLKTPFGAWVVGIGLKIFLILAGAGLLIKIISIAVDHLFARLSRHQDTEMLKRSDTLKAVIRNFLFIVVVSIGVMMILESIGFNIGPVLASAGVLGLALGFGAQELVRDVINGFFILMDDQIRVGDVVNIGGHGGLVESVNLRLTKLRDLSGNVHFVRNGQITVVTNMTKEYSRYVFDVGVAYRENVDEVIEVLKQIDEEMRKDAEYGQDILEPLEILGLDRFGDSSVIVKVRTKTKPIRQWAVGREFNRRMKIRFDELGIEIPFPHMTLYMGQDKDGSAPPVNVRQVQSVL